MTFLKTLKDYWFLVPVLFGAMVFCINLPLRLEATEKRVSSVESRQETIEKYIEGIEEQKKLMKAAPPGWRWNERLQQYEMDPTYRKGESR